MEWISIKDRLPDRGIYVMWALCRPFGGYYSVEGYYDPWHNGMQLWRMSRCPSLPRSLTTVTHWMPLPAPPHHAPP